MAATGREEILARRASQERAKLINETPPDTLQDIFDVGDVSTLNSYQWKTYDADKRASQSRQEGLVKRPLPPEFHDTYGEQTAMFTHNRADYDDDLEDLIAEDDIVRSLIPKTRGPNADHNALAMDALRARRTTIAFLRYVGQSATRPAIVPPSDEKVA